MELAKFALSNKGDVAVYVEHTMSTIECIEQLDNGTVSGKKQENGEDGKNKKEHYISTQLTKNYGS